MRDWGVRTSYKTTFVTSPKVEHSSRTSSLRSRRSDLSSSSSCSVNMRLRTTTRSCLFIAFAFSSSVIEGPNPSSSSHSPNFLYGTSRGVSLP